MAMTLSLLLFMLSLSTIKAAEPTHAVNGLYCSNSSTFAPNSPYLANLKLVLDDLVHGAAHPDQGPAIAVRGAPSSEAVYGSFMCIGNISKKECVECVKRASSKINGLCQMTKVSILWYDQCMLRYSNTNFSGKVEQEPRLSEYHGGDIEEPRKFRELLNNTMGNALRKATQHPRRRYSYREKKLYTFAQCAPHLPGYQCLKCLCNAASSLQTGKAGGTMMLPSCFVRFEAFPFYTSSSKGKVPLRLKISSAIVAGIIGPTLLFYTIVWHLLRGRRRRRRRRVLRQNSESLIEEDPTVRRQITELPSLQFHLQTIEAATNNFSDDNKLGEGGFGPVYKGMLPGGQEIAAKRLSRSSGQGVEEFKTEVELVAKLQHRNLVRLLGFSMERDETILVYEKMPNGSLDRLLFDPELSRQLDWSARYKVMVGVARGLLYLHEDSRLRIIHRDLKASNILLDADMNPKISDFGLAWILGTHQTQASTNRIAGTYGYMSPEYLMFGHISVKSDVFSYGVLMLEIITGKKNSQFLSLDSDEGLLDYVWKHWINRTPSEVVEPALSNAYSMDEVIRCMHIGLLCVQDNVEDRPTMDAVILMLNSDSVSIPVPQRPSFFSSKKYKPAPFVLNSDQSTSKVDQSNSKITPSWFASDSVSADPGSRSKGFEASVRSIRCIGYTI